MADKIHLSEVETLGESLVIHEPKANTQGGQTIKLSIDGNKIQIVSPVVKVLSIQDYFIDVEVNDASSLPFDDDAFKSSANNDIFTIL